MKKPRLVDAIRAIDPEINFGSYLGNDPETIAWWDPPNKKIPSDQLLSKLAELQAEYDSKQYQRDRLTEYPSIQELVVALYDEEDKASIIEKRAAVKAKYPKPE